MVENRTMQTSGKRVKVVWVEGTQAHSVIATPSGEENGFLVFAFSDHRTIRLQKSMVIKIEDV